MLAREMVDSTRVPKQSLQVCGFSHWRKWMGDLLYVAAGCFSQYAHCIGHSFKLGQLCGHKQRVEVSHVPQQCRACVLVLVVVIQ